MFRRKTQTFAVIDFVDHHCRVQPILAFRLTTRVILRATLISVTVGWMLLFLTEPSYRSMPAEQRVLASGFQAMSALTTVGFNTTSIGELALGPTFLILLIMIVGASPLGTGGGLKSTSVSAAIATTMSTLRGRDKVTF